jgi:WXG100 family type VII secretion target
MQGIGSALGGAGGGAGEIRCDYDQMDQVSNQFNQQAQHIEDMNNKIHAVYDKLRDKGWEGQAAEKFFDEMDSKIIPSEVRLKQALEQASQACKQIAQSIKQAEQEASQLFRS